MCIATTNYGRNWRYLKQRMHQLKVANNKQHYLVDPRAKCLGFSILIYGSLFPALILSLFILCKCRRGHPLLISSTIWILERGDAMQCYSFFGRWWLLVFWPKNWKPIRGCINTTATNKSLRFEKYFFSCSKKQAAVTLGGGLTNWNCLMHAQQQLE